MVRADKLIQKAIKSPQNLRFSELCRLCEYFDMKRRKGGGSGHVVYKRESPPSYAITIQNDNGKAKPYQVRQLLTWAEENGLYDVQED